MHVTYFAAVREALELDDVDLPVRLALGAIVAGDLPAVHAWEGAEEALVPRPLGLDYDDLPHAQWNTWLAEDLERRAQSQSGAEAAAALWARTQEELNLGRCDGPFTVEDLNAMYGENSWRGMRCFGVEQNDTLRCARATTRPKACTTTRPTSATSCAARGRRAGALAPAQPYGDQGTLSFTHCFPRPFWGLHKRREL